MKFPITPLSDIHSSYSGTSEIWKEFFNVFLEKYDLYNMQMGRVDNLLLSKYQKILQTLDMDSKIKEIERIEKKLEVLLPKSYKDFVLAGGIEISNRPLEFNFLTYSNPCDLLDVEFLYKDKRPFHSYKEMVHMNDEFYQDGTSSLEKAFKEYYCFPNYFNLFKYTDEDNNILDVLSRRGGNLEIGYFSCGTLPEHKEFAKYVINLGDYLKHILLPFEQTQDGEYEAWFFEDGGFYKFKSFSEMYMVDLIGNSYEILGGIKGIEELFKGVLSKMFVDMPSW